MIEDKRFKIRERKGDNDKNMCSDKDVDLQSRLFKNYNTVPYIEFVGLQEGGNLQAGKYAFYIKL